MPLLRKTLCSTLISPYRFLGTLLYRGSFDTLPEIPEHGKQIRELELVAYTFLSEIAHAISFALYVLAQYSCKEHEEDSEQRTLAMYTPISR